MKVLVYGAGAVGSYLGASLAAQDQDVTFVMRPTAAETLGKAGLRISRPGSRNLNIQPQVVTSLRQAFLEDERYDLILLTVKSYDVAEALNPLIAFCPKPFPPVMTLQNGIGIEEMVVQTLKTKAIIAASLTTPVSRQTPDHIQVEKSGRGLAISPVSDKTDVSQWLEILKQAGIETERVKDFRSMKWSKALLNMIGNASSAIVNRHPQAIYKYEPTFNLEMEMLREALDVMKAKKLKVVDLPGTPTTRLAFSLRRLPDFMVKPVLTRLVAGGRGDKMPSFHMDLASGRQENEVLYHNGAVAAAGKKEGVATPVNRALSNILLKMSHGDLDWRIFDGNPQRLVEEVAKYRRDSH